jgi:hypothetical protein
MWTLLVLVAAVLMATAIVLGLFKAAGLNRLEDLISPETHERDHLREQ